MRSTECVKRGLSLKREENVFIRLGWVKGKMMRDKPIVLINYQDSSSNLSIAFSNLVFSILTLITKVD